MHGSDWRKLVILKLCDAVESVTTVLTVLITAVMVALIVASVFARYVVGDPIGWAEQVAKYLMIWATFLAASLGVREGAHIAMTVFLDKLPARIKSLTQKLVFLLVAAFLLTTLYQGVKFTSSVASHSDPLVWEMSMAVPYAAIPVGCALMLVQLICRYVRSGHVSETATIT